MSTILVVDATEELRPLAATLEESGYAIAYETLDRVLDGSRASTPAVMMFGMLGRTDQAAIRSILRSPDRLQETAMLAIIRTDQLASFDVQMGFDDFIVYPAMADEVLARVLEIVSGEDYASLTRNMLFDPVGMSQSLHTDSRALLAGRASSYVPGIEGLENAPLQDLSALVGAGSVWSTARDLHRLVQAIVTGALGDSRDVISGRA